MSDTKKVGRPRKFDPAHALDEARNVFWSKGYHGTSMKDLTEAMGINSPSLYSAFGDKETLYTKTIEAYVEKSGCPPLEAFVREAEIAQAVRAFLSAAIDHAIGTEGGAKGCYLSSCVAADAEEIASVRPQMQRAIHQADTLLAERFREEVQAGRLSDTPSPEDRARMLFDLRQGLVFRARAGCSSERLREGLEAKVALLLA